MAKFRHVRRRDLVLMLLVAVVALGWAAPAAASGPFHIEAPMKVMTQGLTAEQHLLQEVQLSRRLAGELPAGALDSALRVSVADEEIAAVDQGSRWISPLKIGIVKALTPGIAVHGLDRGSLDGRSLIATGGLARQAADGGLVWAAVVRADQAGAIRLHLQDMSLPKNAALYVYSRSGEAFGPYLASGADGSGDLWTTAVFGGEAILQLKVSGSATEADLRKVSFRVPEIGLITRKFAGDLAGILPTPLDRRAKPVGQAAASWPCGNQACLIDANCENVSAANPAKLAVAKMEWVSGAFIYTCTGGLISDNNPTQSNFLLTANHCFSATKTAKTVSFYWRFATSSCDGTCPSNTAWPYKTTGATVAASNKTGDFTLVQLSAAPPAGSVFLGWTSAPVANTNGAHLYRISNPQFGPQVYSQHDVDTSAGTCRSWPRGERIYSRDITGAIDGGSSGSPVLNASSQIVGQLSGTCGTASSEVCSSGPGEANATVDGAFASYFATVQPILSP
jgi:lysyl endopeptidase